MKLNLKSHEVALAIISSMSVDICVRLLIPWQCRWRECSHSKCWYPLTELRSVIILKLPVVRVQSSSYLHFIL